MQQHTLFDTHQDECLISGLSYQAAFLTVQEERELLLILSTLDLEAIQYKEFLSRRRVVSFGGRYDYQMQQLLPATALGKLRASYPPVGNGPLGDAENPDFQPLIIGKPRHSLGFLPSRAYLSRSRQ